METLDNILTFYTGENEEDSVKQIEQGGSVVEYPTKKEVQIMNFLINRIVERNPDEMVPYNMWNGDCFQVMVEEMSRLAGELEEDPWDVFALFLHKINGWHIEEKPDGYVFVKYS